MQYLLLLDLAGAAGSQFYSHFANTHDEFAKLARIEADLRAQQLLYGLLLWWWLLLMIVFLLWLLLRLCLACCLFVSVDRWF